ncbi:MAG: hypothetical protein O9284_06995 [Steroidobacteraceae bacterium]|jgi:hypothetical protein|nr:hypothetical protein [Steroidobacteraceae bacterium]
MQTPVPRPATPARLLLAYPLARLPALAALLCVALVAALPATAVAQATDPADPSFWYGRAADGSPTIKVYFFWTSRCQHCRAAKPFLEGLPEKFPYVELLSRPTEGSASNARLYASTARALGADPTSVPGILFCGEAQIGFDDAAGVGASIVQRLASCRARLQADPSLLTKPVKVLTVEQRASSGGGPGRTVAIVIGVLFVGLVVAGIVLSKRAAAAKARALERAAAARGGERRKKRR